MSRPARARGLKLFFEITPSVGAESRPTRARGLKPRGEGLHREGNRSRPTRARGFAGGDMAVV